MAKVTLDVCEWRIENFSHWKYEIHGDRIFSLRPDLEYVTKIQLFPGEENSKEMLVYIYTTQDLPLGGNLSFIGSDGSLLCTKRTESRWMNPKGGMYFVINSGLKFEEVAPKIKNNGDHLTVRLCFLSKEGCATAVSTTLDVLNLSLKIDPKSIENLESDDSKNISIIHYSEKNYLNELLLKAVRKGETVEFVLEMLTKTARGISVETQWSLQSTDNTEVRNEENKYLFRNCEPWAFSNSLMGELIENDITMLLSLKIISGDQIVKKLKAPQEISTVLKKTVCFFDQKTPFKNYDHVTSNKTVGFATSLTKDLMCLYQDQDFSDITLKCGDISFPVHRAILSARSPVFKTMLSTDMKETASGKVGIEDLDSNTLGLFLTYLYTDAVEGLQGESALKLYYAADKYQVPSLKKECAHFLSSNVSISNLCDVLTLAHKHGDDDLTSAAQNFVLENYNQVLKSEEWGNLVKKEPLLVAETLTGFAAKSCFGKISPH